MEYRLLYNAAAHFAAGERYPDGLLKEIYKPSSAGLEALCWALGELGRQAELYRRAMGYDPGEMPAETGILAQLMPRDILAARQAVLDAIARGLGDPQEGEVDEVLLELQKKKAPPSPKQPT